MSILSEAVNINGARKYEMGYSPYDLMRHIKEIQIEKQNFKDFDWDRLEFAFLLFEFLLV